MIFYDEIQSISKEAKRMKADGIDIIIALGHSGFEMDRRIAKSIPEVSLVIGGHTNTFLYTPPGTNQQMNICISFFFLLLLLFFTSITKRNAG